MATVIERDVHHSSDSSNNAVGAIVAILAVIVIVGLALFVLRAYPFSGTTIVTPNVTTPSGTAPLNVNVQGQIPTPTPAPSTTPNY